MKTLLTGDCNLEAKGADVPQIGKSSNMAEDSYKHECMRAELLGKPKPDFETFQAKWKEEHDASLCDEIEEEEKQNLETEQLKEAESQGESLKNTGGKLDELNTILSATQKKLDRFKMRCGSVTEIIRTKVSAISSSPSVDGESAASSSQTDNGQIKNDNNSSAEKQQQENDTSTNADTPLARALDGHVDALDSMLEKAERAQYALQDQRKQIRSFLK